MAIYWKGGESNGEQLPLGTFTLRYNKLKEIPVGEYRTDGRTDLVQRNIFKTRHKHRTGSIRAWIDGSVVTAHAVAIEAGTANIDFYIDNTHPDGYLYIEYLPYENSNYYSEHPMDVGFPTTCENRSMTISADVLESVQSTIEAFEAELANRSATYLYTDKIHFLRDYRSDKPETTRDTIQQMQESILHLAYIMDRATGNRSDIVNIITPVQNDDSNLLKDSYIREMREALHILNTIYHLVD